MKKSSVKLANAHLLTINGGSSSIKFALYQVGKPLKRGLYGKVDRIGLSGTNLTFTATTKEKRSATSSLPPMINQRRMR